MSEGWLCPRCSKVNAPWVAHCDCPATDAPQIQPTFPWVTPTYPWITPTYPGPSYPTWTVITSGEKTT